MVKNLWVTKQDASHMLSQFATDADYDTLINFDCDVYEYDPFDPEGKSDERCILKFRKGVFSEEEQKLAYEGLIDAAVLSNNRGTAAGARSDTRNFITDRQYAILDFMIDNVGDKLIDESIDDFLKKPMDPNKVSHGNVWLAGPMEKDGYEDDPSWFDKWLETIKVKSKQEQCDAATYVIENYMSNTTYAEPVFSGIAGYYTRFPRYPWGRETSYTEKNREKFEKCFPILERLDWEFKRLLPDRYNNQLEAAKKLDPHFRISKTVFTTLTINKCFRTAYHLDAGDLESGFSNLIAIGDWKGGYLVLPEVRAAVDLRPGDLLLVANHSYIHGNTPIDGNRMSIVSYFREGLLECGSWEYEQLRKKFIEGRRTDKSLPQWKPLFNGVVAGWEKSQAWYDWLLTNGGKAMLKKYHPEAIKKQNLEDIFS